MFRDYVSTVVESLGTTSLFVRHAIARKPVAILGDVAFNLLLQPDNLFARSGPVPEFQDKGTGVVK
jgi:hypothetical protein